MARLSIREYAKHRGCSHVTVFNAIKDGRLSASVAVVAGKYVVDFAAADREWPSTKQPSPFQESRPKPEPAAARDEPIEDEPPEPQKGARGFGAYAQARAVRENYMARLAKLEFDERSGKLVEADKIKSEWIQVASIVRTKVLGIPSKSRQRMPDLTPDQYAILEEIVRETLEDLSDGD